MRPRCAARPLTTRVSFVPATCRFPPRSITVIWQAALADGLSRRRVRHCVVMLRCRHRGTVLAALSLQSVGAGDKNLPDQIPLVHSLAQNQRKRRISADKHGWKTRKRRMTKTTAKSRNPWVFPSGRGGIRTHTRVTPQGILSPVAKSTSDDSITLCDDAYSCDSSRRSSETMISTDLLLVSDAWPTLPAAVRAGIVAMVKASNQRDGT